MKCPICRNEVNEFDAEGPKVHLFGTMDKKGHIHTHGDLEDPKVKEIAYDMCQHTGTVLNKGNNLARKEYVFHNKQRIGDILMFTCAIRDFKRAFPDTRVNVISTAKHIWDHNPFIDRTLTVPDDQIIKIGPGRLTNESNRIDWHFANAYRVSIEDALGVHIPQGESRPDIYITEEEYNDPRITPEPYWLITLTGEKSWGCKTYPFERWQAFIDQNRDILFYQLGAKEDDPPRLKGDNVRDIVGMTQDKDTGIRDLFKLFLNAEGSIGLVSFQMHLAGAFPGKPCIVVAGAREPVSFTRYPGHRYLSTDGALPCGYPACWHCSPLVCEDIIKPDNQPFPEDLKQKVIKDEPLSKEEKALYYDLTKGWIPRCVDLIDPDDLTRALDMYYRGGVLKKGVVSPKPKLKLVKHVAEPPKVAVSMDKTAPGQAIMPGTGKYVKLVSTARGWGGCARSITTIMKFLVREGHRVEFIPFRNNVGSSEFRHFLEEYKQIKVSLEYSAISGPCDTLLVYADDYVWEFGTFAMAEAFNSINAEKKIMMLNYRRGNVGEIPWTKGWDKYMFLNSDQEKELIGIMPGIKTKVLPPCTELEQFLAVKPDYNSSLRIMRHNSQGDTKFAKDFATELEWVLKSRLDATIHMMPGPSFVPEGQRFKKYLKNKPPIPEFLALGNLFWYSLPIGYMDMGPRVILEAMASGLAVIADNWGGAPDRVTPETGWICFKDEQIDVIKNVTAAELKKKGEAAKQRARDEFIPEKWLEEILF